MGIKEEIKEIYEDMKEDFRKGKEYAYQYRKTIFWIFISFIVMQFTDILSLGASWQNMCEHNPNLQLKKVQKGGQPSDEGAGGKTSFADVVKQAQKASAVAKAAGSGEPAKVDGAAKVAEPAKPADGGDAAKTPGGDAGGDAKAAGGDAAAEKAAYNEGKSVVEAEKKAKAEARAAKAARKSSLRSFKPFQGLKQLGPMSGFFSKIGKYLKGGLFIIGMIIAILFVSVIPIIIFSTLMYYIIKFLTKKVSRL